MKEFVEHGKAGGLIRESFLPEKESRGYAKREDGKRK